MIGYTYLDFLIMSIEFDEYKSIDIHQIIDANNTKYSTNNFKIIEIDDFNSKKIDMTHNYKKNITYNNHIDFWLNKQIVFNIKIENFKLYKNLATHKKHISYPVDEVHNSYVEHYKKILDTYFNDILQNGCTGIYKSYHINGFVKEEYFHNNCEIEGEYKSYHSNGNIEETCNYINGKKHGKWIKYYDNGKEQYWDVYRNGVKQLDWRYMTTIIVPQDYPQNKLHMLCD